MNETTETVELPVQVELVVVLKSGACIGPVRLPWAEAEGVRGMIWPQEQPGARPPPQQGAQVIHISSGDGVKPPWLVAFDRREVAGISAIAIVEEAATDAVAHD